MRRRELRLSFGSNIALVVAAAIALVVVLGSAAWWALGQPVVTIHEKWPSKELFDFSKLVLATAGGMGGVVALVVSYRKQKIGEAAEMREDARLFAEDYGRATEQLGADKAAVRLAGVHALDRLGRSDPAQMPIVMNVLCAYLRIPYQRGKVDVGESQVRLTIERVIEQILRSSGGADSGIPILDIDLTDAVLIGNFEPAGSTIGSASFRGCIFEKEVAFREVQFDGNVSFREASFVSDVDYADSVFRGSADFKGTHFGGSAHFRGVRFEKVDYHRTLVNFSGSFFGGRGWFTGASFEGGADFSHATFLDSIEFDGASISSRFGMWFLGAHFGGGFAFDYENFELLNFDNARVRLDVSRRIRRKWPSLRYKHGNFGKNDSNSPVGLEGEWGEIRFIQEE